jgi:hypothetical protein
MACQHIKRKKRKKGARTTTCNVQTEEEIKQLLATFKTIKCTVEEFHDHRLCLYFHDDGKDRRRNPYDVYYAVEECLNPLERMYHPEIFRTQSVLCKRVPHCPLDATVLMHIHGMRFVIATLLLVSTKTYHQCRPAPRVPWYPSFQPQRYEIMTWSVALCGLNSAWCLYRFAFYRYKNINGSLLRGRNPSFTR